MNLLHPYNGLYTDYYELTMAQGYFQYGMKDNPAVFDYFFRQQPFGGGYTIFAGLSDLLDMLRNFQFGKESIQFLEKQGFERKFLKYLEGFRFHGKVVAMKEGEVVFPYEPCLQIEGTLIETQIVETAVLNLVNFESLIATKAARMRQAAGDSLLMDFGLRRAHGLGGIQASRAAVIGGFQKTSNTYSAAIYGLEPSGTMAHSWIQSFEDELSAFRAYAAQFSSQCVLLVDTYDTLGSGIPNAIIVGREMSAAGSQLKGIRLDSGDLAYLSKTARKMLDQAGLDRVQIIASNQIDEYIISSLKDQEAPIDGFGVGTALVTGKDSGALDGVYKLSVIQDKPTLKMSDNISKSTLPGKKSVYRFADDEGFFRADAIALEDETNIHNIAHPFESGKRTRIDLDKKEKLTHVVMEQGKTVEKVLSAYEIAEFTKERLGRLPAEHKRFVFPHIYRVGISEGLLRLRDQLKNRTT
jgi:nicotinate phosphoribosyltransferase